MRLPWLAATAAIMAASAWPAVDPQLLALVSPDATAIAGVRVDQVKDTPFGNFMLTRISSNQGLAWLATETGFDPRTDLAEIVAAAAGNDRILVARGAFRPERIIALAATKGATAEMYRGVSLIAPPGGEGAVAFLNATIVAAGSKPLVERAVDRWISAAAASGALAESALAASTTAHGWVATGALNTLHQQNPQAAPLPPAMQNLLNAVLGLSAGLTFGDQDVVFQGRATARSPEDAQSLADALKLLASLVQPSDPSQPTPLPSANFAAEGSAVNFSLALPETKLEEILQH